MAKDSSDGGYTASDLSRELMPLVIDRLAKEKPESVFITLSTEDGPENITYRQYGNAISSVAWWLEHEIGKGHDHEGLVYFGTGGGDICYAILLIAAIKAGYHMLFNSPRNSVEAHVNLFVLQNCHTIIVPEPQPPYVDAILAFHPMRSLRLPNLQELFNTESPHYEYTKSFEEARRDPFVSLHTSGSTGLPKPIRWTLGAAAVAANAYQAPAPGNTVPLTQIYRSELVLSAMPMFHAAGLIMNLLGPVYCGHRIILPPPGSVLNGDGAIALIKSTGATVAILPPSTLDEIGKRPPLLETLTSLKYVMAAGGVITKAAGDAIITKTKIINVLGMTEFGTFSQKELDLQDWAYIEFSPSSGIEFHHYSDDEYELVVVRDERLEPYQTCFEIFPDLHELSSHDIFIKHPDKPNLWLFRGRSDDVIAFLNGEKTNPSLMEGLISSRPEVRSALVVGQGRFEAALLIEPSKPSDLSVDERAAFIETLWPTIQEANTHCPAYAKVSKSHILFTTPEKPMSRASKGTVQRKATVANYAVEIDAIYSDAENMRDHEGLVELDINDLEGSVLRSLISVTGIADLKVDEDFISRGIDSLQIIQSARLLRHGLGNIGIKADGFAPSTIYTNPTVTKLTAAVKLLGQDSEVSREAAERGRAARMSAMLDKYSASLKANEERANTRANTPRTVMLTGSTGALGSYLLETLVACDSVSKIYCLNRSLDSEQQQARVDRARGLATQWDNRRVVFLTSNFAKDDLGLGHQRYTEILESVDLVIHNAWQVDFNLSLDSYERVHIHGVRNVIDLSVRSSRQARIFFISSVSAVMDWPVHHEGRVPEEIMTDFTVPQPMGYAESKHVSERLLAIANAKCHVPISICRVGQIAGPVHTSKGMWNKQEWLPSLITSSQHLGALPDSLGNFKIVDWIPIDILCAIIADLALLPTAHSLSNTVFHAANPSITSWSALIPHVKAKMGPEAQIVPLATWVNKLRASAAKSTAKADLDANPAVKLMDFYEGLLNTETAWAVMDTVKTQEASPALRELGPVTGQWMTRWMDQWQGN